MALAVMGVACLLNARRCGRIHCYFTGPFLIGAAAVALAYGAGVFHVPDRRGWNWLGLIVLIGALVLMTVPEAILGKYRKRG
jgi:hypothetical protein